MAEHPSPQFSGDSTFPTIEQALALAGTRHRGPIKRLALWASGAKPKLLPLFPGEETWFAVIGTFVLLSSLVAGLGAFTLAGYYFEGTITMVRTTAIAGIVYCLFILMLERALVRMPLNQVRFSADTLEMLAGPEMDAVFQEIAAGNRAQAVKRSPLSVLGVFVAISPRIALAFLSSFLVAEAVLIAVYDDDIQGIVRLRSNGIVTEVMQSDTDLRKQHIDDIDSKIADQTAAIAPKLPGLRKELRGLRGDLKGFQNDVGLIRQVYAAECNGQKVSYTLSTGFPVRSTGRPGCGSKAPGALKALEAEYQGKANSAAAAISDREHAARTLQAIVDRDPLILSLRREKSTYTCTPAPVPPDTGTVSNVAAGTKPTPKRQASACATTSGVSTIPGGDGGLIRGIGIREAALRDLEQDTDPSTIAIEKAAPCGSTWCSVGRFFVYPSPAGRKVAAIRWILFLIECMAVVAKAAMVLRRRRPYDTFIGALEVVQEGKTVAMAGGTLADVGGTLAQKSFARRSNATAADPGLLSRRIDRQKAKPSGWKFWQNWSIGRSLGRTADITYAEEFPEPPTA